MFDHRLTPNGGPERKTRRRLTLALYLSRIRPDEVLDGSREEPEPSCTGDAKEIQRRLNGIPEHEAGTTTVDETV